MTSSEYHKPETIEFQAGDELFTAVTAADGTTKVDVGGEEVEMTENLFRNIVSKFEGVPVVANHNPRFGMGRVTKSFVTKAGNLQQTFETHVKEAADRLRNDAFQGFSIALERGSLVKDDEGRIINGEPDHLSVQFFPHEPACDKGECNLVFSKAGLSASCFCEHSVDESDIRGLKFDANIYDFESAMEWARDHDVCCDDASAYVIQEGNELKLFAPDVQLPEDEDEEFKTAGVGSGVDAYFDGEAPLQFTEAEPEEKRSAFSIPEDESLDELASKVADRLNENEEGEKPSDANTSDEVSGESTMTDNDERAEAPEAESKEPENTETTPDETASEDNMVPEEKVEKLREELEEARQKAERTEEIEEELSEYRTKEKEMLAGELPDLDSELRSRVGLEEGETWVKLDVEKLREYHGILSTVEAPTPEDNEENEEEAAEAGEDADPANEPASESSPPEPAEEEEDEDVTRAKNFYKSL